MLPTPNERCPPPDRYPGQREDLSSAVLFLDLDRFKAINDSLGHAVGDELLRQAAERLRTAIRKADTVARIGGDEFVILMAEIGDAENAAGIASKVLAALRVPFVIYEHELSVMASCGIAISPADGTEAGSRVAFPTRQAPPCPGYPMVPGIFT